MLNVRTTHVSHAENKVRAVKRQYRGPTIEEPASPVVPAFERPLQPQGLLVFG